MVLFSGCFNNSCFQRSFTHITLTSPSSSRTTTAMSEAHSTFAPHVPTSLFIQASSALRSAIWVTLIQDNPLTWWWQQGRRNDRADMEGEYINSIRYTRAYANLISGPLYMYGAPSRQIAPGKAAFATVGEMKGTWNPTENPALLIPEP